MSGVCSSVLQTVMEKVKEHELKKHYGNYNSFMTIPKHVKPVIKWWIQNVDSSYKQISHGEPKGPRMFIWRIAYKSS